MFTEQPLILQHWYINKNTNYKKKLHSNNDPACLILKTYPLNVAQLVGMLSVSERYVSNRLQDQHPQNLVNVFIGCLHRVSVLPLCWARLLSRLKRPLFVLMQKGKTTVVKAVFASFVDVEPVIAEDQAGAACTSTLMESIAMATAI